MKILLLGASGQLGKEWQRFFSKQEAGDLFLVPYTSSQLDITRYEEVSKEIDRQQPDLIINCAAYTAVDKAETERAEAEAVNSDAVAHLAGQCEKHDVKLLHYSTDYIFAGNREDKDRFPQGYPEDHIADPVNWYGQTKWLGEEAIRNSGCSYLIVRTSWVCGAFGSNFVKTMLRFGKERKTVDIVNDQWGSPGFADEIVANSFKLIEDNAEGTYHLTSEGLITWADFGIELFKSSGIDVKVNAIPSEEYPTDARRPRFSKLDTSKAEQVPGVSITSWQEGLNRLLDQLENP